MNARAPEGMTRIDEIADNIYRISSAIPPQVMPGGFTFNQFLIDDEAPLLFHTGPRRLFAATCDAIARVMPVASLRYLAFSHFEPDECGALNEFLAVAPKAEAVCGHVAALVSMSDYADRPARALADGEQLSLGQRTVQWFDAPHLPHGWDCGFMGEQSTRTLFCGDLFTQTGASHPALTRDDVLEPSEAARLQFDYYSHAPDSTATIERLAAFAPTTLGIMHGPAWAGDGAALLRALARRIQPAA